MATSKQLTSTQLRGLAKAGDVLIPGNATLPAFSRSGALEQADRMLDFMTPYDLAGVRTLFTAFAFLPKPAIALVLWFTEQHQVLPPPLAALMRMANLGVKGIAMTLYYSDLDPAGPRILPAIGWDARVVEPTE